MRTNLAERRGVRLRALASNPVPRRSSAFTRKAHKECLQAAQHALDHIRGRKCTVTDLAKLLELASKLGRLAAGLPSDHTAHLIQDDRAVRVEISAAIKKIYSEPIESLIARMQPKNSPPPIEG